MSFAEAFYIVVIGSSISYYVYIKVIVQDIRVVSVELLIEEYRDNLTTIRCLLIRYREDKTSGGDDKLRRLRALFDHVQP
jgi:hypothetical protein